MWQEIFAGSNFSDFFQRSANVTYLITWIVPPFTPAQNQLIRSPNRIFLKSGSLERFKARSHEDPVSHFTVTKDTSLRRTTDTLKPLNGHLRSTLCSEKISQNENVGALLAHDSKLPFFFVHFVVLLQIDRRVCNVTLLDHETVNGCFVNC